MFRFIHTASLFFLTMLMGLVVSSVSAQVYGNEWIVPGQSYYKIPVAKTGMYALTRAELSAAQIPIGSVDPRNIELWHRGIQQNIYIKGESDGTFDAIIDSLFFYGERNDGTLDSILYEPASAQPHKYYNLYSDTTAYFLTWSASPGKRMPVNNLSSAVSPDSYHMAEILNVYTQYLLTGWRYSSSYYTPGDVGEGWFGDWLDNLVGPPVTRDYVLHTPDLYTAGPDATLEILFMGANGSPGLHNHVIEVIIRNPSGPDTTYSIPAFSFYEGRFFTAKIPMSKFSASGDLTFTISSKGNGSATSSVGMGYMKLTYPQGFNMGGAQEMYLNLLPNSSSSNIEISNPSAAAVIYDITDKDNIEKVTSSIQGGFLKATLAASATGRKLYVVSSSSYLSVSSCKKVDLEAYSNTLTADYIMISNKKIMAGARDYAFYRASLQGGNYDTLLADVDKLYDMFSYGERTPVGIKRFIAHLIDTGDSAKYLFIIGKGLLNNYSTGGPYYRQNPMFYITHPDPGYRQEDLVPTYGVPGSDLVYSMGFDVTKPHVPALATGRLPARTVQEVRDYLEKVKQHDTTSNALWRKNLIHLSGGKDEGEKISFSTFMNTTLKVIAEDVVFGGKVVKSFVKNGTDAVDNELISSVADEVNKGVSYVTFLGHSSPGIIDLDIGTVSNPVYGYNNIGKYPMLFINGCSAGQMFDRWSFAEDWILTANKGAILVLAHTENGFASELMNYSTRFYINAFRNPANLDKSVGDIQVSTIRDIDITGIAPTTIAMLQQMVIQGDPAIALYTPRKPDYETSDAKLFIKSYDDKPVTAVSDSFAIGIVVSNLGVDFGDSLRVIVKRIINGKETVLGPVVYEHIKYLDTIYFIIRSKDVATFGQNSFDVFLDAYDSIPELNEFNNHATLNYFMPLSGVVALFPREYSIVNSTGMVTLVAQSTNLFVGNTAYYFEIDTSYLFNSNLKKDTVVNAGALVKWSNLVLPLIQDSLVYYWRVRYQNILFGEDTLWGESSFIYIGGSPEGWSQSEFPQFLKDGLNKVERDISQRQWEFTNSDASIFARTLGTSHPYSEDPLVWMASQLTTVRINGILYEYHGGCSDNALIAVAFDRNTAVPYSPYTNLQGGYNCGVSGNDDKLNTFFQLSDSISPAGTGGQVQADLIKYIDNVSPGDYVLFLNTGNASFSKWSSVLKNKFKSVFGADYIDSLSDGLPYILLAKKGDLNPIFEQYGTITGQILYSDTLLGTANKGYITSTLIGPASQSGTSYQWGNFYRTFYPSEIPVTDEYDIKIIGVDMEGVNGDTITIPFIDSLDLSTIVALRGYPFIRLLAEVTDTSNLTPPQLKKWQVIYNGVPEGTMNPVLAGLSQYNAVVKQEGDSISVCYVFENISPYDFQDTLKVKYTITNSAKGATSKIVNLVKLKSDTLVTFCYKFSTKGLEGNNILQAYVNPKIQSEEYYNNNIVEFSFTVEKDKTHPVLDVVFDGVHIMDGDVVSPSPMITVTLNDENRFLYIDSPDDVEIFLQLGDQVPQKISATNSDIISAKQVGGSGKNIFQIEYNPKNLQDGIYTLIVRGKDASGNESGVLDYKISFEVINESTISHFYPYPNPFSTSTRFVFTLTGSEIPEDLKIQIMTVTGKVVREITKAELGPIRIGNNKSDYAWDGTDEFGDKLANGVYLYRVIIKNGGDIKHRETAGDKAFKKNFGKLYILR